VFLAISCSTMRLSANSTATMWERTLVATRLLLHEAPVRALQLPTVLAHVVALSSFRAPNRRLAANAPTRPDYFTALGSTI
jgi:hypothetical protein